MLMLSSLTLLQAWKTEEMNKWLAKQKRKPVRIARLNSSRTRRKAIEKALQEHQIEDRAEWDRNSDWGDYRFYRKLVKRGTIRTIELPLLEVTIGDPWSTSVTIIHGKRPGPTITILGGMHGDELTGPSACTHLLSTAFTDPEKPLDPETLAGTIRIVPVVNMPGYRSKSRYFPDGRDLNRNFPATQGLIDSKSCCSSMEISRRRLGCNH